VVGTTCKKYWNAMKSKKLLVIEFMMITKNKLTFICCFERVVKRLYNIREMRSEREFGNDMRKVHFYNSR
jgi:hypothetical protein